MSKKVNKAIVNFMGVHEVGLKVYVVCPDGVDISLDNWHPDKDFNHLIKILTTLPRFIRNLPRKQKKI